MSPTSPLHDAGIRIDPPPSLACAIGTTPAATKAPEPDDDAPAVWSVFHGLRTGPSLGCSAEALKRLVQLYDGWGKKDKADEWRQKLDEQNKP